MLVQTQVNVEEPEDQYHSLAGDFLSSHLLGEFRGNPDMYRRVVEKEYHRPDSVYFTLGRAFHALVLEGEDAYTSRFVVGGPINKTTGKSYGINTKAFTTWASEQAEKGFEVISDSQNILVRTMALSVVRHVHASRLLNLAPFRERVSRVEYCGFPCQIRIDASGPTIGIVDLKSCEDIGKFYFDAKKWGYVNQLAFYSRVLYKAMKSAGRTPLPSDVHIIVVEKKYPNRCGVWRVSSSELEFAEKQNQEAIEELKTCMESGRWPTRYEEVRELVYN